MDCHWGCHWGIDWDQPWGHCWGSGRDLHWENRRDGWWEIQRGQRLGSLRGNHWGILWEHCLVQSRVCQMVQNWEIPLEDCWD